MPPYMRSFSDETPVYREGLIEPEEEGLPDASPCESLPSPVRCEFDLFDNIDSTPIAWKSELEILYDEFRNTELTPQRLRCFDENSGLYLH